MTRAIMIQGAGSNVGKSLIVAGLCRYFANQGLKVRPFKPQNMSNNAAVTADGGEIGRAQALQARAAGLAPVVDMNPVLLKPESETSAQVVVQGQPLATLKAPDYASLKPRLMASVLQSFWRLATGADLVIVEGAGSPAETNLRAGDIANMGFVEATGVPVVLVGDVERGGVIAQMVGTHVVLPEADRVQIVGFLINKFRGDPALFDPAMDEIGRRTGWAPLGVLPWFADASLLPAEDGMDLSSHRGGPLRIAVPRLSRIANFDDLDPLRMEPGVSIEIVEPGRALPGDAALVLIPGTKSTLADLAFFRAQGWDTDLAAHRRRGGHILGVCGGYQMLGRSISDPDGLEGPAQTVLGLGFLNVQTTLRPRKRLTRSHALDVETGQRVEGYEIHIGETSGPDCAHAWLTRASCGEGEGAASVDGRVRGSYLHGLFTAGGFRAAYLERLGARAADFDHGARIEAILDALAEHIARHADIARLLVLAKRLP